MEQDQCVCVHLHVCVENEVNSGHNEFEVSLNSQENMFKQILETIVGLKNRISYLDSNIVHRKNRSWNKSLSRRCRD